MLAHRRISFWAPLLGLALLVGCGSDGEAEKPVPEAIPDMPSMSYSAGHLSVNQRALPLDRFDLQVLPGIRTHSVSEISELFGAVVINAPFVEWPAACAPASESNNVQPAAIVEERLSAIRAAGIESPTVAVNVDILTPGRSSMYHICFAEGASRPRFDVSEYQRQLSAAMMDLADIEAVKYITIGVDMNVYYHNEVDGERPADDYTNFMLTYQSLFDQLKEKRADLKVGPGLNYAYFRALAMSEIGAEYGYERPEDDASSKAWDTFDAAASYFADRRLVEPLIATGTGANRVVKADYIGLSFMPFPNAYPFNGEPRPSDAGQLQRVIDWYRPLQHLVKVGVAEDAPTLPIVVTQADWPEGQIKRPKKAVFLETLKEVLSPFQVEWFAWRRFSDLPDPEVGSPCAQFTRSSDPEFSFPGEYCGSGMVDQYGTVEESDSVFRTLTESP
ncbi:MAG: hypothetical protein ACON3Z_09110 [Bradymonadia bacterium]